MKTKIGIIIAGIAAVLGFLSPACAGDNIYNGMIANETGLAYSKRYVLNLATNNIQSLAVQVNVASASIPSQTFTDGSESTGNITISSWSALIGARAQGFITVASNTAIGGAPAFNIISIASNAILGGDYARQLIFVTSNIAVNGATITFQRGMLVISSPNYSDDPYNSQVASTVFVLASSVSWYVGATSITAASNLAAALNGIYGLSASTITPSTISVTSIRLGSGFNYYTIKANTVAVVINSSYTYFTTVVSSFFGGADRASLYFRDSSGVVTGAIQSGYEWLVGASSQATAFNLAATINHMEFGMNASTSFTGSSVTVTLPKVGAYGNGFTLASSTPTALQIFSSTFTGGYDPLSFSINGIVFTSSIDFFQKESATNTAQAMYFAVSSNPILCPATTYAVVSTTGAPQPIIIASFTVSGAVGKLFITSYSSGSQYNFAMGSSSQPVLTLSGFPTMSSIAATSTMLGGALDAKIKIGGVQLQQGKDFFAVQNNTQTAAAISDALMSGRYYTGTTSFTAVIQTTWNPIGFGVLSTTFGVIFATSIANGSYYNNFFLESSTFGACQISNWFVYGTTNSSNDPSTFTARGAMTGGSDPTFSTSPAAIALGSVISMSTGNQFTLGLAVLFSTPAGGVIGGLNGGTTYFIIPLTTSTFQLARTSSGAVTLTTMTFTSRSTQPVSNTYTLTPVANNLNLGISTGTWQVSNDGSNWKDVAISTVMAFGFGGVYTSTFSFADLGSQNATFLGFNVSVSTNQALKFQLPVNGKR